MDDPEEEQEEEDEAEEEELLQMATSTAMNTKNPIYNLLIEQMCTSVAISFIHRGKFRRRILR
jgi:hypothetical protein